MAFHPGAVENTSRLEQYWRLPNYSSGKQGEKDKRNEDGAAHEILLNLKVHHKDTKVTKEQKGCGGKMWPSASFLLCVLCAFVVLSSYFGVRIAMHFHYFRKKSLRIDG